MPNGHADEYSKPVLGSITGCSPMTPTPLSKRTDQIPTATKTVIVLLKIGQLIIALTLKWNIHKKGEKYKTKTKIVMSMMSNCQKA